VDFHRAVAAATHNTYFQAFVDLLGRQMLETRRVAWVNAARFAGGHRLAQLEHAAIFRTIRRSDPVAARKAAVAHLTAAAERMRLELPSASARRRARGRR
jgi:DNA-binding FadR family transcriptional regulator